MHKIHYRPQFLGDRFNFSDGDRCCLFDSIDGIFKRTREPADDFFRRGRTESAQCLRGSSANSRRVIGQERQDGSDGALIADFP
jgi:hypothetical protein